MRIQNRAERRGADGRHLLCQLEQLEDRRLRADSDPLTTYTDLRDELWDVGWSVLFGTVRVGDASRYLAAVEVGDAQQQAFAYANWDADGGRFDSGWRDFWFHADVRSGVAVWSVQGAPQVWHASDELFESVTEVIVVAAVRGSGLRMSWENLAVIVRNGDTLQGPEYAHGSLRADTFGRTDFGAQQQQTLHVHAPTGGLNEVIVQGSVRLEAEPGVQPDYDHVFGQVLIRAA